MIWLFVTRLRQDMVQNTEKDLCREPYPVRVMNHILSERTPRTHSFDEESGRNRPVSDATTTIKCPIVQDRKHILSDRQFASMQQLNRDSTPISSRESRPEISSLPLPDTQSSIQYPMDHFEILDMRGAQHGQRRAILEAGFPVGPTQPVPHLGLIWDESGQRSMDREEMTDPGHDL